MTDPLQGKVLRTGELEIRVGRDMAITLALRDPQSRQRHPLGTLRLVRLHSPESGWFDRYEFEKVGWSSLDGKPGKLVKLSGKMRTARGDRAAVRASLEFRDDLPLVMNIACDVSLPASGMVLDTIVSAELRLPPVVPDAGADPRYWSFQGGSYPERPDWIMPISPGYTRENFQGMNAADYGGGMPIVDVWCKRWGVALASLSDVPEQISLPVRVSEHGQVSVALREPASAGPLARLQTIPVAVIVHRGDYFNALRTYGEMMRERGIAPMRFPASAYDVEWCAWGYERSFVPGQILATLGKARDIGAGWATVDDGWQNADGDWLLDTVKFPGGAADMKALVDSVHRAGLKARLWWVPMEAHDSAYSAERFPSRMNEFGMRFQSLVSLLHPDWFQLNNDSSRTQVSWWNSYVLCPAVPAVRDHYRRIVTRMIQEWGFDGLKIDGQNLNSVPPCFNPSHNHASPDDAPKAGPEFFREIVQAVTSAKPDAVIQMCACGTNYSLYNIPFVHQPVGSDPLSPWQVRLRGKAYKALMGGNVPYSGDHVELTNRRWDAAVGRSVVTGMEDFASTIGVGGVPATKFTSPEVEQPDSSCMLTGAKEVEFRKWLSAYNRERPSEGLYRNLYDMAYDRPEMHAIEKDGIMYYAIFADSAFSGPVSLRGLSAKPYDVIDYIDQITLGQVDGPDPMFDVSVRNHRLLKAVPR